MGVMNNFLAHAWNAFTSQDHAYKDYAAARSSYGNRPDRLRSYIATERSLLASIYNRISVDVAGYSMRHIRLDDKGRYLEDIDSALNDCFTVEANQDQAARYFRQNVVQSCIDEGTTAVAPIDVTFDPRITGGYDILSMRVGKIIEYSQNDVKIRVFNEETQRHEDVLSAKKYTPIIENPFYAVMNEPNSTLQRLLKKLNLLDVTDDKIASGKLDIIIQLPYAVRSETRKQQAAQRLRDIEVQLQGSKYGIAYADATEKITQLNRPAENSLLEQVKSLRVDLMSELGLTEGILNGTAEEPEVLSYHKRICEPFLDAIVEEYRRKFLTKTARTQKQTIQYFRDPFAGVPIKELAEAFDIFARNELASSNELRQIIHLPPSKDPKADELINSNMPVDKARLSGETNEAKVKEEDKPEQAESDTETASSR